LAVEEHFYIILPLLLLFMVKRKGGENPFSRIPLLALAISALVLTLRCLTTYLQPTYGLYTHRFPTHLCIDALFFGVLISYSTIFTPMPFETCFIDGLSLDRRRSGWRDIAPFPDNSSVVFLYGLASPRIS